MAETKLSFDEAQLLRVILATLSVKSRTGELGILHGMDRFVTTQIIFRKQELEILDSLARKVGVTSGVKRSNA